jgi:hypothetical protein
MPASIYRTIREVDWHLRDYSDSKTPAEYRHDYNEEVCQGIVHPLLEMNDLAHLGLEADVLKHPHIAPGTAKAAITDAMRLAYGIDDLITAGKKVKPTERQRRDELFAAFDLIEKVELDANMHKLQNYQPQHTSTPPPPAATAPTLTDRTIESLRDKLEELDQIPENEACRFKLETELYNLEHSHEDDDSILDAEFIG